MPGSAQLTMLPTENQCDCTATPSWPLAESMATIEKACRGRTARRAAWAGSGGLARAARAAASVTGATIGCRLMASSLRRDWRGRKHILLLNPGTEPPRPSRATTEKRPTLSRELADFLIEFSIALHKHAMYPGGHPTLLPAAEGGVNRLGLPLPPPPRPPPPP